MFTAFALVMKIFGKLTSQTSKALVEVGRHACNCTSHITAIDMMAY